MPRRGRTLVGLLGQTIGRLVSKLFWLILWLAVVGGLLLSQVLTLFTTPVIYLYFDRLARRWAAWRKQRGLDLNTEAGLDGDAGR